MVTDENDSNDDRFVSDDDEDKNIGDDNIDYCCHCWQKALQFHSRIDTLSSLVEK